MLLRYAVHVASGHGMVWNVGDAPLDGATDLLFTLAVAGAMRLGVSVEAAARLIGVVALISFHAYFSTLAPPNPATRRAALDADRWAEMTLTLYDYAETRGYHLAACFGLEPGDAFFYYLRPDLPDAQRIIDAIRSTRYYYRDRPAIDFARATNGRTP